MVAKKQVMMGEVLPSAPLQQSHLSQLMPGLLRLIEFHGYAINSDAPPPDIAVVKGNVNIHCDSDFGIVALALLEVAPLCKSPQVSLTESHYASSNYLWTKGILTAIEEGDAVIFDTDREHAWFCSGVATFVTIPVKRQIKLKCDNLSLS